ncbi:MaoC family dehydratase N-terminal domain-containing protein [Bosea sp. SSUT16]|jgi:acyl dehydratase|uniref:MaoC family dehydratase N-terminal domain-containing protein n=1 Tax=Bosea spartocytisi TaxID=2773451 RepID=A0A927E5Y0_9HYPH|nr:MULTISPECIES: MaoC/PaaZ C-terminal domain-containing protein [Bosea]MBD3845391.1 MaoC family dehydratase N-terminal domain-containing protein [Bosea spartocytisi]MCT4472560.1 MaoC/PaaZ C-terminal domain-containing protein [Bosea spartocytisi]
MLPGKFYEEIQIGDERLTPRVTVTEGHVLAYAGVAGDFSPIHMDEVYAQSTVFGGRIAHGLMGLSLTDGMKVQSGFFHDGIALGWSWNFKKPIRIGDTLQVKFRVADMRIPKSRSDMGILTIAIALLNQHGEVVQEGEHRLMVPRKPDAGQAEAN